MTCSVRLADDEDLGALLSVCDEERDDREPSELEAATWDRMMTTEGLSVYLAEVDGKAVGTASLLMMPNLTYGCAPTAFIEAVVVLPAQRRQGIASALLVRLLEDAESAGCNKVQLLSHKRHADDGAHELYLKAGFEPEAEGFRRYLRARGGRGRRAR